MALLATACLLVWLVGVLAGTNQAAAYDVCSDPGSPCTHEIMTQEARDLYFGQAGGTEIADEIDAYWHKIEEGVGNPDQYDPLYDNTGLGSAIVTISHFWHADVSLGFPMELGPDDYPNALNAAQALWSRALGEYAAGDTDEAYRHLGMVAHFLGDQSIPTHAHNDTHGPDELDDDAFEEWMSVPGSGRANLSLAEEAQLTAEGLFPVPADIDTDRQFLWIFLNANQVADYFASDDVSGDSYHPTDSRYPWMHDYASDSLDAVADYCSLTPTFCPLSSSRLIDNDFPVGFGDENNDDDGDLSAIRGFSYPNGVRALATLFDLWEQAVQRPLLTVTIHRVEEIGKDTFFGVLGLDDYNKPDYYVGFAPGYNERS